MRVVLPSDWTKQLEEAQRLRGWLVNGFAQVEYLLGDLILRCQSFPAYEEHTRSLPHGASDRIVKIRKMLRKAGPLDPDAAGLDAVLDRLSSEQETRNLLVHGFATFLHTPTGDVGLHFQKFHRQPGRVDARLVRTFTIEQLAAERDKQGQWVSSAVRLFARIHERFGWVGPMAQDFVPNHPFSATI